MKNIFRLALLCLLCISALGHSLVGQEMMKTEKRFKNTVRLNLTNPLIFGDKSLVVGYERTFGDHQSASINIGQAQLPKFSLINVDSSTTITKSSKEHGFNMTIDYRFYLAKENKYFAPRGIYLAPYVGYTSMGRENTWNLNTDTYQGDVTSDFNFHVTTIGGELGYQFVIWKRFAIDLVLIGPGLAFYSLDAKLDTSLSAEDEALLYEKINEALTNKFPGYSFAIDDVDFKKTGSSKTTSFGYRYVVNLGFRF